MEWASDTAVYLPTCFRSANRGARVPFNLPEVVTLDTAASEALANLLPLLGCGEEAAALAFDSLAASTADTAACITMGAIAAEEMTHDALLKCLQRRLPAPHKASEAVHAMRRFHIGLGRGGPVLHLARIAAIDAAVCTILGRLLRPAAPLYTDPAVRSTLARIRREEARHVRVSRDFVLDAGATSQLRDIAAAARAALADILMLAGDAFDRLEADPDALFRDVRRLPDGLFTA